MAENGGKEEFELRKLLVMDSLKTMEMIPDPDAILDLVERPRRLRNRAVARAMMRETSLEARSLVQPLFVKRGIREPEPIGAMPGVCRLSPAMAAREARELQALGIPGVALFPVVEAELKDATGQEALNPENLCCETIAAIHEAAPGFLVIADVALDPYTTHGHDGVVDPVSGAVRNDATVAILREMATVLAAAGADWVAPSDMMDGRVGAIRASLDAAGFVDTAILAYAAKFNSAYYGPFRDAVGSARSEGAYLDKSGYQLDPANRREALRECQLDASEGADLLMVKPAGPYLDIIRELRDASDLPVAAYQVSGEYAQIVAAAERGWLDRNRTRDESLLAIRRAGADLILTYFAKEFASLNPRPLG